MITGLLGGIVLGAALAATPARATPTFADVKKAYQPSEAWLLDRHGEVLEQRRVSTGARRLAWVELSQISPALSRAILKSEDQRFHDHDGVDWRAVFAAAAGNTVNEKTRGASTITMQVAGLIDPDLKRGPDGRSFAQKVSQARAAMKLEKTWSKAQILEAYLNLVAYRGELEGVGALSWRLFGRAPHALDETESAIAAALLRGPNAGANKVAQRACLLVVETRCEEVKSRTALAFTGAYARMPNPGLAPHLAAKLATQPGARVTSTLDARLQKFALQTLRTRLIELNGRNVEDGAVIVIDNANGEVLAWVGSSGELSNANQLDHVTAPRQAGSTLKPFLYAQAIAARRLTAASILDDSPAQIRTPTGLYIPRNYSPQYRGQVSVRQSLGGSLNVPAVRTLVQVGPDAFVDQLRALGLSTITRDGDYYGYSLALGSAEVTLAELSYAYRALARGGALSPLRTQARLPNEAASSEKTVLDPGAAWIVTDILADDSARALAFGFASVLRTRAWSAVKTGTSKDMRDNWAVGFTSRYTVGVWVGNSSGAPMHAVSGVSGAAPVWHDIVTRLHRNLRSDPPAAPAGVVASELAFVPAVEPARREWFMRGTETRLVEPALQDAPPRLKFPVEGTVIALDPDIPPAAQRMHFDVGSAPAGGWLELNGVRMASARQSPAWQPMPGRHRVRLMSADGKALDEAQFEVRGASFLKK